MRMIAIAGFAYFCVISQLTAQVLPDTTVDTLEQVTGSVDTLQQRDGMIDPMADTVPAVDTSKEILTDTIPQTDGYYQVNDLKDAIPFAYPKVNPKNIRFYKRIWRDIDLADKENYIFATPGASLMEAIMKGIQEGKLTPYNPEDDGFKTKLTAREGEARFTDSVLVPIFDDEGNQIDSKMALNEFDPAKVTKFRIKEDMFFDKQRGRLETRIIGVAPLMKVTTSSELAESVGETPAFWLYFPQLRYTLVQVDVSDPDRELYDMTMDDLFVQRKFASRIIRESSPGQSAQLAEGAEQEQVQEGEIADKISAYKKRLWRNPKGVKAEDLDSSKKNEQKGLSPKTESKEQNEKIETTEQEGATEEIETPEMSE